ncbi:MAG: chromate transporter [Erysipelotrichaceae bacterium]|nr:chromate transporter [Erysipelotrichaceae bacterium]
MNILTFFLSFFQIGLFSFGGGYASVPLIQSLIVKQYQWLTYKEFMDLITIAELTPGPIMINAATFVGMKSGGILLALISTLGSILPSLIIVMALAWFYQRYKGIEIIKNILKRIRPLVVAMILSAGLAILFLALFQTSDYHSIKTSEINLIELTLFIIALYTLRRYKVNPILIIFSSGLIGTFLYLLFPMI